MQASTLSRYTNEVCISTHLHLERCYAIPSSGQRQSFCRLSAYATPLQRRRTGRTSLVLNIFESGVLAAMTRDIYSVRIFETVKTDWTIRIALRSLLRSGRPSKISSASISILSLSRRLLFCAISSSLARYLSNACCLDRIHLDPADFGDRSLGCRSLALKSSLT